jgi:hypothetical protein
VVIVITDTSTSSSETIVHGSARTIGEAQGPLDELKFSGSYATRPRRKVRAANAEVDQRGGHIGRVTIRAERPFATASLATAWVMAYLISHLTADSVVITNDDATVTTLNNAALVDYDLHQVGVAVMCSYTFEYGAITNTTPEPEE